MKKIIGIKNEKELNKFYRLLFIYRSFLYKFTTLELKKGKYYNELDPIVKALNIKRKNKRTTYIYDYACSVIDEFQDTNNVCDFKDGKCLLHRLKDIDCNSGCCGNCIQKTTTKCSTKNLSCKFFYCSLIKKKYKVITFDDLKILKCLTYRQQLILKMDLFTKRKDVLMDLYIGSIIIASIRIVYRLCRQEFIKKKK